MSTCRPSSAELGQAEGSRGCVAGLPAAVAGASVNEPLWSGRFSSARSQGVRFHGRRPMLMPAGASGQSWRWLPAIGLVLRAHLGADSSHAGQDTSRLSCPSAVSQNVCRNSPSSSSQPGSVAHERCSPQPISGGTRVRTVNCVDESALAALWATNGSTDPHTAEPPSDDLI